MDRKALVDSGERKVDEREESEDRDEHVVVDDRRVAAFRIGDDVANERHD